MAETSISGIEFKIVGSTGKAKTSVDKLTSSLKELKTALSSARTAKLEKELEGIDKNAKKSTTTLGKLFKSVGRIGFYRAIRSALKYITDGFREGLQNAYQFSKVVGYDLAATMDNLATKSLTMKNQLGSAFGSLIMAVEPILLQLIALVTRAANALAQFFAAIGGKETYLKAIDTVTQYGEAVGGVGQAAKEAMRYLAPFDELNVLPAQNEPGGGGGGASTPDYSQMFEESPVMQKLAEFGASLRLSFNDMFIDWDDLTPEQISEKIIGAILGLTGFLAGIAITGSLTGGLVVGIAGVATALVFNSVVFDHDGKIDKSELQSMLRLALIGITGGIIGFTIGGPGGALIGASIGFGLDALLEAINFFTDGKLEGAMEGLVRGISAGLGGVIGFMIGGPAGAVLGATIGLGISFGLENFVFGDTTGWSTGDWIRNIVATLAPVAGAAIGLVVGGPAGALIGATIGLGIQFALNADTTDGAEQSGKTIGEKILEGIGKPFKTIGDWIKEHIIDPIKEKIKGFSLTELLFGNGGEDDSGIPSAGSAASFGYEIEVTGIKDSIPLKDKIINGVKAAFGSTDGTQLTIGQKIVNGVKALFGSTDPSKLTTTQKTVPAIAKLGSYVRDFTSGTYQNNKAHPLLYSVAKLGGYVREFASGTYNNNKANPLLYSYAKLGSYVREFASGTYKNNKQNPLLYSYAKLGTYIREFGSGTYKNNKTQPLLSSVAKLGGYVREFASGTYKNNKEHPFLYSVAKLGGYIKEFASGTANNDKKTPKIDSQVNFTSRKDSLTADQKTFGSTAKFNTWKDNLSNVWSYAKAWFNQYNGSDIQDWNNPWMWTYGIAYLNKSNTDYLDTPWVSSVANLTSAVDNVPWDQRYIEMSASIVGVAGQSGYDADGAVYLNGVKRPVTMMASGGMLKTPQLFVARERGPELVGTLKGHTAVMNNDQIVSSVSAGVARAIASIQFHLQGLPMALSAPDSSGYDEEAMYRAMLRALNDSDVFPDEIDLDGDVVYRKMVKRNQMNTRMTGVNVMATA